MKKLLALLVLSVGSAHGASVSGQGTWETTLQARDIDSDGVIDAYYDASQDITWLADANYAQTSGYDADGLMNWDDAQSWVDSLNSASHLGVSVWRLPTVTDTGEPGCDYALEGTDCGRNVDVSTGEMAHMYYISLGNISYLDPVGNINPGWGLSNTGPFANLNPRTYWSGVEYPLDADFAYLLNFNGGFQGIGNEVDGDKSRERAAWAVINGDIALVPIPAAAWLFGSALAGLGWIRRKQAGDENPALRKEISDAHAT